MELVYDTEEFPVSRQLESYESVLAGQLAPFRVRSGSSREDGFRLRLYSGRIEGLELSYGQGESHSLGQSRRVSEKNPFAFALLIPQGSAPFVQQFDSESCDTVVQPGQLMLNDSRQSGWVHMPEGMDLVGIHFPEGSLPESLASPVRHTGRLVLERRGEAAVLAGFAEQVASNLAEVSAGAGKQLAEHLVGLVGLALRRHGLIDSGQLSQNEIEREQLRRAWELVERQLHRTDLTAGEIAGQLGVSERHFFRLLRRNGLSFQGRVLERRLERTAAELADPALSHLTINAVAIGNGFASSSHFFRVFRQRFGCTPSEYRSEASGAG